MMVSIGEAVELLPAALSFLRRVVPVHVTKNVDISTIGMAVLFFGRVAHV